MRPGPLQANVKFLLSILANGHHYQNNNFPNKSGSNLPKPACRRNNKVFRSTLFVGVLTNEAKEEVLPIRNALLIRRPTENKEINVGARHAVPLLLLRVVDTPSNKFEGATHRKKCVGATRSSAPLRAVSLSNCRVAPKSGCSGRPSRSCPQDPGEDFSLPSVICSIM